MTNNEPFQAFANAARAKMFKSIDARKHHLKVARLGHQKIARDFNDLANYYRRIAIDYGNAVILNKSQAWIKFWDLIECN